MNMSNKLEYLFKSPANLLFKQISTPEGLSGWFADDVILKDDFYVFKWRGYEEIAQVTINNKKMSVQINWLEQDKNTELQVAQNNLTNGSILIVVDSANDENFEDFKLLWDSQISILKKRLGEKN